MYFCFINVTKEIKTVLCTFKTGFQNILIVPGFPWIKAIIETATRCDTGGHQPQHCSTEFKTVVIVVFQHSSEFLIMLSLLQHQEYNQLFVIEQWNLSTAREYFNRNNLWIYLNHYRSSATLKNVPLDRMFQAWKGKVLSSNSGWYNYNCASLKVLILKIKTKDIVAWKWM